MPEQRKQPVPLKHYFNHQVPRTIARQIRAAWPAFREEAFVAEVLDGYEALELMDRGRHVARVLRRFLPDDYPAAVEILLRSAGERPTRSEGDGGMASFLYLPHTSFVEEFGLEHFDTSMKALHHLTQLFTGEFAIRPFLDRYPERTLAVLRGWARDPNAHVRRLVSEGTRPRLPWGMRLRSFQADPGPVLELLEMLKDDPEEFVRRSVANNLNDIGKDHPDLLVDLARRWMAEADGRGWSERRALVRHALRSLVKKGHPAALEVLGFGGDAAVRIDGVRIIPGRVTRGGRVTIEFDVRANGAAGERRVLVDLRVNYVKANGGLGPKVFKLRELGLRDGETVRLRKTLSLAEMTTRRHYPGRHPVEALVNGRVVPLGSFELVDRGEELID